MAADIAIAGHLCLDIIPDLSHMPVLGKEEFFRPGAMLESGQLTFSTGGAVANVGLALVRLGAEPMLIGKIGGDAVGRQITEYLAAHGGDTSSLIVDPHADSSYTVVISPPGLDRMFLHCPGANNAFGPADIDYERVAGVRMFHFGYPPAMRHFHRENGRGLVEMYRTVRNHGVVTSLDLSLPDPSTPAGNIDWQAVLAGTLPHVDVFVPSFDELLYMLDRAAYDTMTSTGAGCTGAQLHDLAGRALAMGAAVVMVKLGARGAYIRTANTERLAPLLTRLKLDAVEWADRELWHPAFRIDGPPQATGSGDAAIAGLLMAMLQGCDPVAAVRAATATGACSVTAPDATSGLVPWTELQARLESGWPTVPLEIEAEGWREEGGAWQKK